LRHRVAPSRPHIVQRKTGRAEFAQKLELPPRDKGDIDDAVEVARHLDPAHANRGDATSPQGTREVAELKDHVLTRPARQLSIIRTCCSGKIVGAEDHDGIVDRSVILKLLGKSPTHVWPHVQNGDVRPEAAQKCLDSVASGGVVTVDEKHPSADSNSIGGDIDF
jgi:hypothetical protein